MGLWNFVCTGAWTPPPTVVSIDGPHRMGKGHTATVRYSDGSEQELLGDDYALHWYTYGGREADHYVRSELRNRFEFARLKKEIGLMT